jgi:FAD/FMN-containing dehydrogenase
VTRTSLHSTILGNVLEPGDPGYDEARTIWNAMVDRRPRFIVQCAETADVIAAVRFGSELGLDVGVRCGGHGIVGHAVPDDGLMIDLRRMDAVTVEPRRRRAQVQGGALLGALDRASQAHGLATTAGNVSHTGVGGLTLGGGMGWLARRHGLTCDNVKSFELVTASGEHLHVDAATHPDLSWALRGGGGNFGIVTAFEFALHPEPGRAISAELVFPIGDGRAAAAMRRWRDLSAESPRDETFVAIISGATVSLGLVQVGDPASGRSRAVEVADQLAAAAEPTRRSIEPLSYLQLQTREDDIEGHAWRRYWKGHYFSDLGDELIDVMLERDGDDLPDVSLQAYGGAIAEVPDEETAFSRRDTAFEFVAAARWRDSADDERRMSAARHYAGTMERFASGAYVNVLGDEGEVGIRRAYTPDTLARLTAVKDAYDPGNLFHLNQNIRPSAG